MDELVDILDKDGNTTGKTCMKSEAHLKGYWHPCVHVWLYTKNGKVLIQKRKETKKEFPSTWDVSVAGHIGAGENVLLAAQREVNEEVGFYVKKEDFAFIGNYKTNFKHHENLIDKEYHHIYIAELTVPVETLRIQAEEVSEIQLIPITELEKKLKGVDALKFVSYEPDYFNMVFSAINVKINSSKIN